LKSTVYRERGWKGEQRATKVKRDSSCSLGRASRACALALRLKSTVAIFTYAKRAWVKSKDDELRGYK
jgi:hypothetical protein